ncbi:MAG: alpha-amylase [Ruminococcus sp.]|nr:alpha-amylase [Ruminococcus sp.]
MKKVISLLLVLVIALSLVLSGCSSNEDPVETNKVLASTDKYRTYYQIWIGSFCDSDGDETGDFEGIISKLDYLNDGDPDTGNDLGIDGIWLSPMMPSYSYHKYNVENYFDIDPEFGTLEIFDKFMAECDKRGISVIIDLVVNHSASNHPYFIKACDELREGKEDGYAQYYNFKKGSDMTHTRRVTDSNYFYEGQFSSEMPDWNLSYDGTREYFEEIVKFWLERGVDGFRLDAVKYFSDAKTDGIEFMEWFYTMAQKYNEDVYMVGEDWDSASMIYDQYLSGIDSFFNFKFATATGDYIMTGRNGQTKSFASALKKFNDNIAKRSDTAINANFLTNHDMPRVSNTLETYEQKFAASLYLMSPGNSFTYYGEEIGIEAPNTTNDASYRTAMIWDNDNLPNIYVNGVAEVEQNPLGGVKQQLEDENSLLNAYRRLIKIRNQNPEIARGKITDTLESEDVYLGGYYVEYEGEKLLIIHYGGEEVLEYEVTDEILANAEFRGGFVATNAEDYDANQETWKVTYNKGTLKMPPMSTAVLKAK